MRFRLEERKDCLVLNLCRQTSEIRPSLTFLSLFYKAFDPVFLCPCYARFNRVTPDISYRYYHTTIAVLVRQRQLTGLRPLSTAKTDRDWKLTE